jgi:hypothetical protein
MPIVEIPWTAMGQVGAFIAVVLWLIVHYDTRMDEQSKAHREMLAGMVAAYQGSLEDSIRVTTELLVLIKGLPQRPLH